MSVPFCDKSVPEAGCASKVNDVAVRASSYGMDSVIVDGMDVLAVREAVQKAVAKARKGEPMLIEARESTAQKKKRQNGRNAAP